MVRVEYLDHARLELKEQHISSSEVLNVLKSPLATFLDI